VPFFRNACLNKYVRQAIKLCIVSITIMKDLVSDISRWRQVVKHVRNQLETAED